MGVVDPSLSLVETSWERSINWLVGREMAMNLGTSVALSHASSLATRSGEDGVDLGELKPVFPRGPELLWV